jgi:hypothetical protein
MQKVGVGVGGSWRGSSLFPGKKTAAEMVGDIEGVIGLGKEKTFLSRRT